jgi:hypothetical protein
MESKVKKATAKLPKSLTAPSDDKLQALFDRPDIIYRDPRPHDRGDFNAFCSVVFMLLITLIPPDEHRGKYALLKELTDRIARDPNRERMVWYLNRFLRTADDFDERLNDIQRWSQNK